MQGRTNTFIIMFIAFLCYFSSIALASLVNLSSSSGCMGCHQGGANVMLPQENIDKNKNDQGSLNKPTQKKTMAYQKKVYVPTLTS